jgi:hypothetical protein
MPDVSGERPDPAARPDAAGKAMLREAYEAGQSESAGGPHFEAWYESFWGPDLPAEPPNGSVRRGSGNDGGDVWQREDEPEDDTGTWWLTGSGEAYSYERALNAGLDPARQLVELPDPATDQVEGIANALSTWVKERGLVGQTVCGYGEIVAFVVRALSEQGAPDGQ